MPLSTAVLIVLGLALYYLVFVRDTSPLLDPVEYRNFELVGKKTLNPETIICRFRLPRGYPSLGLPLGKYIILNASIAQKEVLRPYTPLSSERGCFELLVKIYPTGQMSKYLAGLELGDTIRARGPGGKFIYTANMCKHVNMIAGGSGIMPMFQIIQAVTSNPHDRTTVDLIYSNVYEEDILLYETLQKIANTFPQIRIHFSLDNPPIHWPGARGFVTRAMIQELLPPPDNESRMLLCGPFPMMSAVKRASFDLGWEKCRPVSRPDDQVVCF